MENFIIIAIVLCIIAGIAIYLYKAKKRGETCIGCPYAKQCGNRCGRTCRGEKPGQKGFSDKEAHITTEA